MGTKGSDGPAFLACLLTRRLPRASLPRSFTPSLSFPYNHGLERRTIIASRILLLAKTGKANLSLAERSSIAGIRRIVVDSKWKDDPGILL